MVDFFQTPMGRKFYECDVPKIADALAQIEKHLRSVNPVKDSVGNLVINSFIDAFKDLGFESEFPPASAGWSEELIAYIKKLKEALG